MEETKCSTKAQNVFKNVKAVDKDQTFDTDVYERKQREGASDKMAETMEICTKDAEAALLNVATSIDSDAYAPCVASANLASTTQLFVIDLCDNVLAHTMLVVPSMLTLLHTHITANVHVEAHV